MSRDFDVCASRIAETRKRESASWRSESLSEMSGVNAFPQTKTAR